MTVQPGDAAYTAEYARLRHNIADSARARAASPECARCSGSLGQTWVTTRTGEEVCAECATDEEWLGALGLGASS